MTLPVTANATVISDDHSTNNDNDNHNYGNIALTPIATACSASTTNYNDETMNSNAPNATTNYGDPLYVPPATLSPMQQGDIQVPIWDQPKLGSNCCWCWCDFRRATIIVNAIIISLSAFSLFSLFNSSDSTSQEIQILLPGLSDQVAEELADIVDNAFLANAIIGGILLVFTAVPLYGAYLFNVRMIAFGIFSLVASYVTRIALFYLLIEQADAVVEPTALYMFEQPYVLYVLLGIVMAFCTYPHVFLIIEIRHGIMSLETYPREDYSCCCRTFRPPPQQ